MTCPSNVHRIDDLTGKIMRFEGECDICIAEGARMRENDMVLCDTCYLLAETEPEGSDLFNSAVAA